MAVSPEEALQLILDKLEGCGIDYMLTGSFASNMHGVPRRTYDADIVAGGRFFRYCHSPVVKGVGQYLETLRKKDTRCFTI